MVNKNTNDINVLKSIHISIFFVSLPFGILSFLLPVYCKALGANAIEVGLMFSVLSLVTLILRPVTGKVLDLYGRKKFFVAALFIYSITMAIFSLAVNTPLLYVARIFQGIGSAILWTTSYTLASDLTNFKDKGRVLGTIDEVSSRGSLIGAIIGFTALGFTTLMIGWRAIFMGYAVLAAIGAVIAWAKVPETEVKIEPSFSIGVLNKKFIKILSIIFIASFGSSMLDPVLLIYIQDKFSTDIGVLAIASIPAAVVMCMLPSKAGQLSDKVGRMLPLKAGLFICGAASILIINSPSIFLLVLFWIIEAVGISLVLPSQNAIISDMTDKNVTGTSYGLYMLVLEIGNVIGPLVGGILYDTISHEVPFYFCGVIILASAIAAFILFRNNNKTIVLSNSNKNSNL